MKAVIDTNVLIYDTFEDSIYHLQARKLLDELGQRYIPAIVVHEYVWALKSLKISPEDVLYKVEEIMNHHKSKLLADTEYGMISALGTVVKENLSLSRYNDKVILSAAIRNRASIATFDEKLRKQALFWNRRSTR
ncbi:PilT protein domain protein [Ferroglobus placidus DSM 10642]|uniref:PilT protein domain protein n=1 Tax=Ferroglobus placidus (strain DSM 10642 / AEDII12DO) TaxID=589924 RepID=D3RYZ5_FERPA|nr:PIN domain-containing protein [Ferroglobus placidus]ADC65708.1 PilT protein domain protein [Ferroglobus placidus DSM 10642]